MKSFFFVKRRIAKAKNPVAKLKKKNKNTNPSKSSERRARKKFNLFLRRSKMKWRSKKRL